MLYLKLTQDILHCKYFLGCISEDTAMKDQLDKVWCWRLFLEELRNFRPFLWLQKTSKFHRFLVALLKWQHFAISSLVMKDCQLYTWFLWKHWQHKTLIFIFIPVFLRVPPNLTVGKVLFKLYRAKYTMNFLISLVIEHGDTAVAAGIFFERSHIAIKNALSPCILFWFVVILIELCAEDIEGVVFWGFAVVFCLIVENGNDKKEKEHYIFLKTNYSL